MSKEDRTTPDPSEHDDEWQPLLSPGGFRRRPQLEPDRHDEDNPEHNAA